jgi:leucyl-tRNA synthetase
MNMGFYSTKIDKKWQNRWEETKLNKFDDGNLEKKLYVLEMFSYPSGSKLHAGHWFNYGPTDSWARMKRMQGYNVFQPMGFDAFGLPAENYAIKTGIHPWESTLKNIETMEIQLKAMGAMFSWENEVITCQPEYYRWSQWIFLKFYEKGLAYKKKAPVNWCPSCNTVLANEQVVDGECERCHALVTKKDLSQWFFKITDYAEELLQDLDKIDWPEKTKAMQRNWIGKSIGAEVVFKVDDSDLDFTVFTTRIDTLFGCSYCVIAPENDLVDKITTSENRETVENYIEETKKQSDIERQSLAREKTGVFTGSYAINPINGRRVPILIADYVLNTYGTGCVMGVPSHDERDFDFATKYNLPIERVITGGDLPSHEYGKLVNSGEFTGMTSEEAIEAIIAKLESEGKGKAKINFRLRDWLVSRQRYWGTPIPMVYCDCCGAVPVPESDLPVVLPHDVEFSPDGTSPLLKSEEFMNTTCPVCGGPAKREADTLDTFICSSWYFLRYADNLNDKQAWDPEKINKILPVDMYVGGAEHAVMHLLYARFFVKALRDMGYLNFDEPFKALRHQGTILGPDGTKMSKSKGNTISPDEYIEEFGSDVFRMYLMFGFDYASGGAWSDDGIKSIGRFVDRVERVLDLSREAIADAKNNRADMGVDEKELNFVRNYTIKSITEDCDRFQFNTSIARMMEFTNALMKYANVENKNAKFLKEVIEDYIMLLAPFAPHFSEEQWELLGNEYSVFNQTWPTFDPKALIKDEVEIAIQVNGKIRSKVNVSSSMTEKEIETIALEDQETAAFLEGKKVVKVIVIKGRLVNIVVK